MEPAVAGVYKFKLILKTFSERLYNGINCKFKKYFYVVYMIYKIIIDSKNIQYWDHFEGIEETIIMV